MGLFVRLLAATLLITFPGAHGADAQIRPFARPPVLPPTVIPLPLTPRLQPLSPLPSAPAPQPLPLPGPVFGAPPPPPDFIPAYSTTLWGELGPAVCDVDGTQVALTEDVCEAVQVSAILWGLRDPSRQSQLLKELARKLALERIRIVFNEGDPIEFRAEAVAAIYTALQAEFDNVLHHAAATLIDAPEPALLRRIYAIADAAAVTDLRFRVAEESRQHMSEAVSEVRSEPDRHSFDLPEPGLAYRQAVAGSLGRNVFDSF